MNSVGRILFSLDTWFIAGPLLVPAIGIGLTLHISKFKWLVHTLVLAIVFFVVPYFVVDRIINPVDDGPPGPMNPSVGFVMALYFSHAAIFGIAYAGYAFMTRTSQADVSSNA